MTFREYAKRRVRDAFQEHKNETDSEKIKYFVSKAEENLALMKRQVLYSHISMLRYVSQSVFCRFQSHLHGTGSKRIHSKEQCGRLCAYMTTAESYVL